MRIVSLLPAATEVVAALDQGHFLTGRSHECDHPPEVSCVAPVTEDLLPPGSGAAAIDAAVRTALQNSGSIYRLDEVALATARPDIVITQTTCSVCAVDAASVERAVGKLADPARIISYDPHRLVDLAPEAERVGRELGDTRAGLALRSHIERRLAYVTERVAGRPRPRLAVIEWPEPLFAAGHWVPDVVEAAGATSVFGQAGQPSTTASWEDLAATAPDVLVLSFCGFDLRTSIEQAASLVTAGTLQATGAQRVVTLDGSAWLSRPGPRLLDAVEALAWILHRAHPEFRPRPAMAAELVEGEWVDVADGRTIA